MQGLTACRVVGCTLWGMTALLGAGAYDCDALLGEVALVHSLLLGASIVGLAVLLGIFLMLRTQTSDCAAWRGVSATSSRAVCCLATCLHRLRR